MTVETAAASRPGSAKPNEDCYLVADRWALVLDGITRYPDDGCVHDVPWYVARLAAAIASRIADPLDLPSVLAAAIDDVNARHVDTCDLDNPVSPGATVAVARFGGDHLEWLVLGDSAIAWRDRDGKTQIETDDRLSRLVGPAVADVAGTRRWPVDFVAAVRNREHGFWVASTDPAAAAHACTGTAPLGDVAEVLLCTDGLTRLVDQYGYSWPTFMDLLAAHGVPGLIDLVRRHETGDTDMHPEAKRHDDATAVHVRL